MFDEEGQYIIAEAVDSAYSHPVAERSRIEKDLLKLDERVNILYSLQQGRMFALFLYRMIGMVSGIRLMMIYRYFPVKILCLCRRSFIGI